MDKKSDRMKWISVKKQLPRIFEEVLVYVYYSGHDRGSITDSRLDSEGNWMLGSASNYKLTHWMKYPLKPRGEW